MTTTTQVTTAIPEAVLRGFCIALTGGIATGKSTVAGILRGLGRTVIDADQLAREVTARGTPTLAAIVARFGDQVTAADGSLDRARLGAIVFADPAQRRALESITHPAIRAALLTKVRELGLPAAGAVFFYEAALIFEAGTEGDFKSVWATDCPANVQIDRLIARNNLTRARAEAILASQMPAAAKAAKASVVIRTDLPLCEVEAEVRRLNATV